MEEKKKFNKKKLALFALPILALMVVGAALVSYLSAPANVSMSVQSPLDLGIDGINYTGSGSITSTGDTISANVYGADTFGIDASLKNNANNPVTGFVTEVKIHNDAGISTNDLSLIYSGYGLPAGTSVPIALCQPSGEPNNAYAYIGSTGGDSIAAGEVQHSGLTVTMNQYATGNYTGTVQVIDVANKKC